MLEIDTDKFVGLPGGTFFAYGLYNNDTTFSDEVLGDTQVVSNIDTNEAVRLFELWYDQSLFDDRLSFRFGLYDLNSEFDVNETGTLFVNSSHGIGPDFSQTGESGPSIFPVTSLALRARWRPTENLSVQAVVLDAVPGDPVHPSRTTVRLDEDEGVLSVVEFDYVSEGGARFASGYWRYTAEFDDLVRIDALGALLRRDGNDGFYMLAEGRVFSEADAPGEGLSVYARYGQAEDGINQFGSYLGLGAVYTGLLPGRPEDQLGFNAAIARNGEPFRRAQALTGSPVDKREAILELTYRAPLRSWLAVQPTVDYVVNPGTDRSLKDALAVGLRFEIGFGLER